MEILQNHKKRFLVCISDLIGTAHDWLFVFKLAGAYMSSIPYLKKKYLIAKNIILQPVTKRYRSEEGKK